MQDNPLATTIANRLKDMGFDVSELTDEERYELAEEMIEDMQRTEDME